MERLAGQMKVNEKEGLEKRDVGKLRGQLEGRIDTCRRSLDRVGSMIQEEDRKRMMKSLEEAFAVASGADKGSIEVALAKVEALALELADAVLKKPNAAGPPS